ncbi:hypothetical protein ACUOFC_66720, partial [Escherichia sp. TWPC-MK]
HHPREGTQGNHYPHQKTESVKEGSDLSEKPEGLEMTVMTLNLVEKQPAAMRRIIIPLRPFPWVMVKSIALGLSLR